MCWHDGDAKIEGEKKKICMYQVVWSTGPIWISSANID